MRTAPRPIRQSGVSSVDAASVAPEVKTTCSGLAPTSAATVAARILDQAARGAALAMDRGRIGATSSAASIAARAAGSSGALAL